MGSKILQEDNRVPLLLKPQPFGDKITSIPIPISILIPTAADVTEAGRKQFPVNLMTRSEPAVKVGPNRESTGVVVVEPAMAEASSRAVHKIPSIPIPISILIPTAADVAEMGGKKFPVNLITGSEPAVKVGPKEELTDVVVVEPAVAEASNWAVQMAMRYKAGGGKMGSVIPKKRKLVKTMMYHSIKDFVISLFRPPPSDDAGTDEALP